MSKPAQTREPSRAAMKEGRQARRDGRSRQSPCEDVEAFQRGWDAMDRVMETIPELLAASISVTAAKKRRPKRTRRSASRQLASAQHPWRGRRP